MPKEASHAQHYIVVNLEFFFFKKGTTSLTKPVSSHDTTVHSHTNPWSLRLSSIRAPHGATAAITTDTQISSSPSCHPTHTHTSVHGETTILLPIIQPPHCCIILARHNHSLMGGLTNRYCYSLGGLVVHTNRTLCRSCYQQRWSGYLHAYNGLE